MYTVVVWMLFHVFIPPPDAPLAPPPTVPFAYLGKGGRRGGAHSSDNVEDGVPTLCLNGAEGRRKAHAFSVPKSQGDVLVGIIWGVLLSLSSRLSGAAPGRGGKGDLFELFAFSMSRVPFGLHFPFRSVLFRIVVLLASCSWVYETSELATPG